MDSISKITPSIGHLNRPIGIQKHFKRPLAPSIGNNSRFIGRTIRFQNNI